MFINRLSCFFLLHACCCICIISYLFVFFLTFFFHFIILYYFPTFPLFLTCIHSITCQSKMTLVNPQPPPSSPAWHHQKEPQIAPPSTTRNTPATFLLQSGMFVPQVSWPETYTLANATFTLCDLNMDFFFPQEFSVFWLCMLISSRFWTNILFICLLLIYYQKYILKFWESNIFVHIMLFCLLRICSICSTD